MATIEAWAVKDGDDLWPSILRHEKRHAESDLLQTLAINYPDGFERIRNGTLRVVSVTVTDNT